MDSSNLSGKCNGQGQGANYESWTKTGLIQRLRELESELRSSSEPAKVEVKAPEPRTSEEPTAKTAAKSASGKAAKAKAKGKRKMDPSRYASRHIALKLAYLGKNYGGFEFQAMGNLSTIEEELWNALTKACLIFPDDEKVVQFDCCEYSKCGRTDRGVSAFGQVIGLRVRSNRPLPTKRPRRDEAEVSSVSPDPAAERLPNGDEAESEDGERRPFDDVKDELCYPRILNRLLPNDIRVLAWCPSPPADFSARFSCRERQYRYFFTQPAFSPVPCPLEPPSASGLKSGWLDIEAMRDAAKRFEGEHDFRNVCKVDPAKQIINFKRHIFESDIVEVEDVSTALPYLQQASFGAPAVGDEPHPKVYYFHVRGSAFLWHQIRHMVALLFLVGQRLESPEIVSRLLDVAENPRKPSYVMANEVPLVLWDCLFPDDALPWVYVGEEHWPNRFGQFGLMDDLWEVWRGRKMDELLAGQLLRLVSRQGSLPGSGGGQHRPKANAATRVYEGANGGRLAGRYVPVMNKELQQSPEDQNDKYAKRKGYADADDMRAQRALDRLKGEQGELVG
ncbi:putative pseudouridine synthase 3 [Drechmeria coniospora]|uniref:Putative pseudouridine synthase 3 n=1 Tax=Drechmeria coniospora TaxID=98403 RepID=A0A151GE37_DRECN|nr:putative pseudouridine synthase 3 [Drechmeria coniospora]KYK55359.1 putative pseudouridine synthase 3 [Drechmeria coniospora]